jgi:hypothetical protein
MPAVYRRFRQLALPLAPAGQAPRSASNPAQFASVRRAHQTHGVRHHPSAHQERLGGGDRDAPGPHLGGEGVAAPRLGQVQPEEVARGVRLDAEARRLQPRAGVGLETSRRAAAVLEQE